MGAATEAEGRRDETRKGNGVLELSRRIFCFLLVGIASHRIAVANMSSSVPGADPTNVDQSEDKLVQEFLTVIDSSVQDCNSEVKVVLESQKDLQKSLHRLGAEVQ